MKHRTRKIQAQARANRRKRQTTFLPSLTLAGDWFRAAGFEIGQQVSIQVEAGRITVAVQ